MESGARLDGALSALTPSLPGSQGSIVIYRNVLGICLSYTWTSLLYTTTWPL